MSDKKHCAYCPGESYSHDPSAISWARGDAANDGRRAEYLLERAAFERGFAAAREMALARLGEPETAALQAAPRWVLDAIRSLSPEPTAPQRSPLADPRSRSRAYIAEPTAPAKGREYADPSSAGGILRGDGSGAAQAGERCEACGGEVDYGGEWPNTRRCICNGTGKGARP